jgi:hypothetical protein
VEMVVVWCWKEGGAIVGEVEGCGERKGGGFDG